MEIVLLVQKSSRHQKIIGDFGENLICNWLSRSGYEVTIVDHTGIDVLAYDSKTQRRLGISVKSRTRNLGKELTHVNLFNSIDRTKILEACDSFAAKPWIAVYVETANCADVFLTSLDHYEERYYQKTKMAYWKMRPTNLKTYDNDEVVMHLHFSFEPKNWFK